MRRLFPVASALLALGAILAGGHGAGLVACSSGGSAGSGGSNAVTCMSNLECAYPNAICDQVAQVCVECMVESDCFAAPGTVCSQEVCVCPPPLQHCPDGGGSAYCVESCSAATGSGGSAADGG
jgi:hypothetical protein